MLLAVAVASCSPVYVERGDGIPLPDAWPNQVLYRVYDTFRDEPPRCITIADFKPEPGADTDAVKIRTAVYGQLAGRGVALETAGCDVRLEGDVIEHSNQFLGVYSRTAAGVRLRMLRGSVLLWEGEHVAASFRGGVPLDPFSLVTAVASAASNVDDDTVARTRDDLARRLVSTIPEFTADVSAVHGAGPERVAAAPETGPVADPIVEVWFRGGRRLEAAGYISEAVEAYKRSGTAAAAAGDEAGAAAALAELKRIAASH